MSDFLTRALGSTEETWSEIFAKNGAKYVPTRMVAYTGGTQTACGLGQAAMGPFYCPNDNTDLHRPGILQRAVAAFRCAGRLRRDLRDRA